MRKRKYVLPVLLVLLVVLLCGCKKVRKTEELDILTMGVDVARYQGIIDWQQVADSGLDFAMVRVGYRTKVDGEMKEDSCARYNLQEAAKAEIPLGVYYFSTAISEKEAIAEAEWVVEQIEGYPITYPVVYDCEGYEEEDSRQYSLTKSQRTDIALAFLKTIEKHGYEGMFYSSRNEMHNEAKWEVSRISRDYKIWVAQYPEQPYPQTPESTYFDEHHMWQYSTTGNVPGISQNVDLNVAYFGYDGIEKPHSAKQPENVEADVEALLNFQEVDESVTAKEKTNLRDIPSQGNGSHVLCTLRNGQTARRIAVCDSGWSKLEFEGNIYYAKSSLLTTDLESKPASTAIPQEDDGIQTVFEDIHDSVTPKIEINLRALPSVTDPRAVVVATVKHGEVLARTGINRDVGWSRVIYKGQILYCVSQYLTGME